MHTSSRPHVTWITILAAATIALAPLASAANYPVKFRGAAQYDPTQSSDCAELWMESDGTVLPEDEDRVAYECSFALGIVRQSACEVITPGQLAREWLASHGWTVCQDAILFEGPLPDDGPVTGFYIRLFPTSESYPPTIRDCVEIWRETNGEPGLQHPDPSYDPSMEGKDSFEGRVCSPVFVGLGYTFIPYLEFASETLQSISVGGVPIGGIVDDAAKTRSGIGYA